MRTWKSVRIANWWVLLAAGIIVTGCGGSSTSFSGAENRPNPRAIFVNASPDAGLIDFLLNNEVKVANSPYAPNLPGSLSFLEIPFTNEDVGTYDASTRPAGGASDTEIDNLAATLDRDTSYLVVLLGLKNYDSTEGSEIDKRAQMQVLQVDRTPPNGSKSKLLVLNAFCRSKGNYNPNLAFQTPGDNSQFKIPDIAFGAIQPIIVDSGTQTFQAKRGDTDNGTVYAEATKVLVSGKLYLVVISGVEKANSDDPPSPSDPKITFIEIPTKFPT